MKRVGRPMLGFKSNETAQRTIAGFELMHLLKKGRLASMEGNSVSLPLNSSAPWPPNSQPNRALCIIPQKLRQIRGM